MHTSEASEFVAAVGPLFAQRRQNEVPGVLSDRWNIERLLGLLCGDAEDASRIAAASLALTATPRDCDAIARNLRHPSDRVSALAEEVLWQVWMRAGSSDAVEQLARAVEWIQVGGYGDALEALTPIRTHEPDFAEVHHQAGIALHCLGDLDAASRAYAACCSRNPNHFAARAALGHAALEREQYIAAADHYRASLSIHPRQPELRSGLRSLQEALARRIVA